MFRKSAIFKFLASLKLAILLLVVIIVATAAGTYYETQYSPEMARRCVYGSVWFDAWLTLLCVNLFCVAAIRYPWKPHQTGFVITHAGIIILLIGAMIDRHWGIEGFVELHRGRPPTDVMNLREQQLVVSVETEKGRESAATPMTAKAMVRQFTARSPVPDVRVDVLETKDVIAHGYYTPAANGPAAVHLMLRGVRMGRFDRWLRPGQKENLGIATISLVPGEPPPTPQAGGSGAGSEAPSAHGSHGSHAPMSARGDSAPANVLTLYMDDGGKVRYVVKSGKKGEFGGDVEPGKYVMLEWGESGAEFAIGELYPHAAAKIEWRTSDTEQSEGGPELPAEIKAPRPGIKCRVAANGETKELWLGQRPLQWYADPDTQQTIVELPREFIEAGGRKIGLSFCSQFVLLPFKVGLLKFLARTDEGSDTSFAGYESTLSFEGRQDYIALKPEAEILKQARAPKSGAGNQPPLPDALAGGRNRDLFGAIVGEDATELTMEFPNRQTLAVPKSDVVQWVKTSQKIYMNNPTTYPSTWLGPWLGTTYKFSQAEHHWPADKDYSGVQVLRDPGWMPKWLGCLMICFGIFTMFYLKPYFHGRRELAKAAVIENKGAAGDKRAEKDKKRATMAETRRA